MKKTMLDLFKTKTECLLEWCQKKRIFSTVEIMQWGLDNGYIRAKRTVQDWVNNEEHVRALGEGEKEKLRLIKPGHKNIGWYTVLKEHDTGDLR